MIPKLPIRRFPLTMPNLLLIDGNNLAHRVFWTHRKLTHGDSPVGLIFGFFKSLVSLKKKYPDHTVVSVWDSTGSYRRRKESEEAVVAGIIPSHYKANRHQEPQTQEEADKIENIKDQLLVLQQRGLPHTNVIQVSCDGYEGDDVICSYALKSVEQGGSSIIVSSDTDFYQLLRPGVSILDSMKDEMWTYQRFLLEFGFDPKLWIDVRALQGKTVDNVFGAPGWGPVNSIKYIRDYGDLSSVMSAVTAKEKRNSKEESLVSNIARVRLAQSLKRMDIIPELPPLESRPNEEALRDFFLNMGFASLLHDTRRLTC